MKRTHLLALVLILLIVLIIQGFIPWWVTLVGLVAYLVLKQSGSS